MRPAERRTATRAPWGYDTRLGGTVWFILAIAFTTAAIIATFNADNAGDWFAMTAFFGVGLCILPPVWLIAYGMEHVRRQIRR